MINRPLRDGPGYTAHLEDAATGLNYLQQRYYDPQLGLFLSVDPVSAYANPIGQFHRYRYANNNPYRHIDPDGRASSDCTGTRIQAVCDSGIAGLKVYGADDRKKSRQETPANETARGAANAPVNSNEASDTTSDVMSGGSPIGLITLFPLSRGLNFGKWVGRIFSGGSAAARAGPTTFKSAHYATRLEKAGVSVARAESAVAKEVAAMRGGMDVGADVAGRMRIDNILVEYRARLLPDGSVNVGTIFPVKP